MQCPKCKNPMYEERILVGGGSGLNRQEGEFHNYFTDGYKCIICGEWLDVEQSVIMPLAKAKASPEIPKVKPVMPQQGVVYTRKIQRGIDLKKLVDKNIAKINEYRNVGLAWDKIAQAISTRDCAIVGTQLRRMVMRFA